VRFSRLFPAFFAAVAALAVAPSARAEDPQAAARAYYGTEMSTSFLFVGYGAVTAGAGGMSLAQSGDFAHGFGGSSLALGGLTVVAGLAYAAAVKIRGDYFTSLAGKDPVRFKAEEGERIRGTNQRFWLYLGSELVETLVGVGLSTYGFVAKNDLYKGIGAGTALQGIGLFVIDTPGAGRAARYEEEIKGERTSVGLSAGGGTRPWSMSLTRSF
jgi:hypothetical protein